MDYRKDRQDPEKESEKIKVVETTNVPVIEESVTINKEMIETGKVTIQKKVREEQVRIDVPLIQTTIEVERVPMNNYVDIPPQIRYEGETTVFPILKEVIEKRLVLVEEVRVTRKTTQTTTQEDVTLRKEEINVERVKSTTGKPENFIKEL